METNKKSIILALLFSLLSCLGIAGGVAVWKKKQSKTILNKQLPTYKICISTLLTNPFTEKTIDGFISQLKKSTHAKYDITVFNAFLDKNRMRSQTEEIILAKPDLIFSVGRQCSMLAKELTSKRNNAIPIVFGGVKDPVLSGLMHSEHSSGNNVTGVTGIIMNWEDQLDILFTVLPTIRHAVIIGNFHACTDSEREIEKISKILKRRGVQLDVVVVNNVNEVIPKTKLFLNASVDVLFCLRDDSTISCMDALVKICNEEKIVIFSTYLDGVKQGAALGLGVFEKDFGTKSAQLAMKILEEGIHPNQLPLVKIKPYENQLHINSKTAPLQGLIIEPTMLFFIENAHII